MDTGFAQKSATKRKHPILWLRNPDAIPIALSDSCTPAKPVFQSHCRGFQLPKIITARARKP